MNNIFVGNLPFRATKEDVIKIFEPFGTVAEVTIVTKKKDQSLGYGFVDMPNEEERKAAIAGLDGREFMMRVLSVSVVLPRAKGGVHQKSQKPVTKTWQHASSTKDKPKFKKEPSEGFKKFHKMARGS